AFCLTRPDRGGHYKMTTMRFASTRNAAHQTGFSDALLRGIAPDGGLYVPQSWPQLTAESFGGEATLANTAALGGSTVLAAVAARFIAPFAAGDRLEPVLGDIVSEAFN